jgi:SAM-dependent methyltransferase
MEKSYWENRYAKQETGWDMGSISPPLQHYFETLTNRSLNILIPGCGNAWEAAWLHEHQFSQITIIDFAEAPLLRFRENNPSFPKHHVIQGDFFDLQGQFDLIVEQTFFCAIQPSIRLRYVQKMNALLKPGGHLAGLFFNDPSLSTENPPFRCLEEEYKSLFSEYFCIKKWEMATDSIAPRAGRELFLILEKS